MDLRSMPLIKFEIEGIKSQIASYLGTRGSELEGVLAAEIGKAIASFPLKARVQEIVHYQIARSIEVYFQHGKGADAIEETIDSIFSEIQGTKE